MFAYETHICGDDKDWAIFIHGLGGNSGIWYKQVEAYKSHFNLMFIDMYGHGNTRRGPRKYSFEDMAGKVVEALDREGIESAHFVGISLGSIVIDAVSRIAPERIKSMVLGGAVMGYDLKSRFLLRSGALLKHLLPYMWLYRLFAWIMMPRRNHSTSRRVFIREAKKLGGKEFKKWFKLMETLEAFYASFPLRMALDIPKLYISGEEDHLFLPFVIENYLRDQASSIHIIQRCGHVCNIEQHREFNRISLHYLNSYPDMPAIKNVPVRGTARRIPQENWAVQ